MKMILSVVASMLVVMGASPVSAQGFESRGGAERQEECRSAAAVLEAGAWLPDGARATLRQIRNCDVSGGPALARAWREPSLRAEDPGQLVIVSWEIHDRRIMQAVIELAQDEGAEQSDRFGALSVLASYLDPPHTPSPNWYPRPGQEWPMISTVRSHGPVWRSGTQPIEDADKDRIMDLLAEIESATADLKIQRVAWYLLHRNRQLRDPSPGVEPPQ